MYHTYLDLKDKNKMLICSIFIEKKMIFLDKHCNCTFINYTRLYIMYVYQDVVKKLGDHYLW